MSFVTERIRLTRKHDLPRLLCLVRWCFSEFPPILENVIDRSGGSCRRTREVSFHFHAEKEGI